MRVLKTCRVQRNCNEIVRRPISLIQSTPPSSKVAGKHGKGRVIRKGGVLFFAPFSISWNKEQTRGRGSREKNHVTFRNPRRMEKKKKSNGPTITKVVVAALLSRRRILDPPATKSQLIYNDPILTPAQDSPVYLSIRAEKEERKVCALLSDNSLFIRNVFRPPSFFLPTTIRVESCL